MTRTLWPDPSSLRDLTDHQRSVVATSLASPFGLLCGVPGAGKTWVLASIIEAISRTHGLSGCSVAAPTGKAAVRITENLQRYGLRSIEAKTIHRTLGVSRGGYDGKGWGFEYGPSRPLPARFLFVDEFSMADTQIAADLFSACRPGTHVLCVGDPHQLPPVGSGAPLRDLLSANVSCGTLTEIKRNSGTITEACRQIREGLRPKPCQAIRLPESNWVHREWHRGEHQMLEIKRLLTTLPDHIHPVWDVQVLCAVNDKGDVSRRELNKQIQEVLNPHGVGVGGRFRTGDKVICTSNTLLEQLPDKRRKPDPREYANECYEAPREFIANGEVGRVVGQVIEEQSDPKNPKVRGFSVRFDAPERTVLVPLAGKKSEARGDDEHAGAACDFDLAYAITTHKAQGSQAPIVIVVVDDNARFVCSREWWYTACSRAEQLLVTVGRLDVLHKQCRRSELTSRKTFMAEGLTKAIDDRRKP